MPPYLRELVKQLAAEAGFDLAGIAPVSNLPELDYFRQWIARGFAGEMRYMEARDGRGELKRASLASVAPWARSVIVCAVNYNTPSPVPRSPFPVHNGCTTPDAPNHRGHRGHREEPQRSERETGNGKRETEHGWISRYAWSQRDYHEIIMERLRQVECRLRQTIEGTETRCYVDTGPLVERAFARYAGIGWVGKNTCIINQRLGSWLFLGVILTSLELPPDLPAPDRCGACTRCLDACPTAAFTGPRELDARRCISYLTIEKRGAIPEDLRAGVGSNVFGCDICQDVCPWNRRAPVATAPEFQPRPGLVGPSLEWLATISEEDFRQTFRGSPIKRAKRTGLRRNAVVAMGNSGDRRFLPLLRQLAEDPDPIVAGHAKWAIEQL
ncbi:MAG: tRNA epoxyqueuosine(34) reductase QueG [Terriglobales bacterium]